MSNNQKKKVIIIGSGLGGIATALRLSYAGHEVTICEKSSILGGKIGIHEEKGFIFDLGPSLITFISLTTSSAARKDEVKKNRVVSTSKLTAFKPMLSADQYFFRFVKIT